jgi:hypothetical protein
MPLRELAGAEPRSRRWRTIETGVVLRAAAVVLVVAHHALWSPYQGGAHLLLAIAGYNFARFGLAAAPSRRLARSTATLARVAVPTAIVIAATSAAADLPAVARRALHASFVDQGAWPFWFVGVLICAIASSAALMSIPRIGRREQQHPFAFALGLFAATVTLTYAALAVFGGSPFQEYRAQFIVWVFVLGWLVQRAVTPAQKAVVSAVAAVAIVPYFDRPSRSAIVLAGVLLLVWVSHVRVPAPVVPVVSAVAGASLYIYLTHFEMLRRLGETLPRGVAVGVAVVTGVVVWEVVEAVSARIRRAARRPNPAPRARPLRSSLARHRAHAPRPSRSRPAPAGRARPGAALRPTARASR